MKVLRSRLRQKIKLEQDQILGLSSISNEDEASVPPRSCSGDFTVFRRRGGDPEQKVKHARFGSATETMTYYQLHHANGALASDLRNSLGSASAPHNFSDHLPLSSRIRYTRDGTNEARNDSHEIDAYLPVGFVFAGADWKTIGGTKMTYDTKGRLSTVGSNTEGTLAGQASNLVHTYSYHLNSAIPKSITSNDSTKDIFKSTYRVDRRGRVLDVVSDSLQSGTTLGLRTAVGYTYNAVGQRIKATREDGYFWKYDYNNRGEVTSAKKHLPGGTTGQVLGGLQFEYDYDDIGNRTEMRYGGDESGSNLRTVDYDTNGHNQYTSIDHPGYHHVTGLAGLTGSPAAPGTIKINTSQATLQENFFFKELQESNTSNPVSVPIVLEETPNGGGGPNTTTLGDVYVPKKVVAPQYENGNLINDGRWIYTWNASNRLIRMEPTIAASAAHSAAGHTTALPVIDFLYDWMGRRISKMVTYGTGAGSSATLTSFVYDGWNIVATVKQTYGDWDLQIVRSVWGLDLSGSMQGAGGVGGLLATRTTDAVPATTTSPYTYTENERHFPSFDGNGNIIAWTTDDGTTTTTRDFDAFGNVLTNQGTRWNDSTPYGFSTKYEDVETGLLYYGYRYYDPVTGRWPSRDPIGERGGVNLYGMVGNDAVGSVDFLGMDAVAVSGGINTNIKTDPTHDQNWRNFITAAKVYIKKLKKNISKVEEIEWHVEKSSYIARESSDDNSMEVRWDNYYIKEIEKTAKELGVKLIFYNNTKELIKNINGGGRKGTNRISDFSFFGHGNSQGFFPEGMTGGEARGSKLTREDLKLLMVGSFYVGCKCTSFSCNTATKDEQGISFADAWLSTLGLQMWAIKGRARYHPTAVSKKKVAIWHVKEIFTDAGEKPRERLPVPGTQNDESTPSEWVAPEVDAISGPDNPG